ncbi:unnamed protein product [Cuscuta campestris]|uniref:Uncharacterized protein n=1 Tax=Cuscuta campestris TaxID=132261 RepID=A0A484L733_9ASTE|nr:unnamed protein product [Cuscuta campestris]
MIRSRGMTKSHLLPSYKGACSFRIFNGYKQLWWLDFCVGNNLADNADWLQYICLCHQFLFRLGSGLALLHQHESEYD